MHINATIPVFIDSKLIPFLRWFILGWLAVAIGAAVAEAGLIGR